MKVALIQPNTKTIQGTTIPPFGLMYIGSIAKEMGHKIKIFDRNLDFFTFTKLKKFNPDLVGISGFTGPCLMDVINIAKQVKKMFGQSFPVLMGGVHATVLPEQTLENPCIDYVIMGEGEYTFLEFLKTLEQGGDMTKVKGVGFKKKGVITINERRPLIENLDKLPLLNWNFVNYKKYFRFDVTLITSRGCPYRCGFCYNMKFNEGRWRGMSAKRVIQEIKAIEKLTNNKNLGFHDDNFTADRKRMVKILDYLSPDYNLFIETRVNYIDKDFLSYFKKFKSVWFFLGVESGSQRILNKLNKGIAVKQIENAFDLINKYKFKATASVIVGSPTETKEEVQETMRLLERIKPTRYTLNLYTPYPGSLLYDEIVKGGLLKQPKSMEEWSKYALGIDSSKKSISSFDASYLKKLDRDSWIKTIMAIIKTGDLHKIKMRIINYEPFVIPLLDLLDKLISRAV